MTTAILLSLAAATSAGLPALGPDEPIKAELTLMPKGAQEKTKRMVPLAAEVTDAKPEQITKAPSDLKAPRYALIRFGDFTVLNPQTGQPEPRKGEAPSSPPTFAVILDEPEGEASRIFVDTNRNGDLTDDPAPEWKAIDGRNPDGSEIKIYTGSAPFDLGTPDKPRLVHLGFYRFEKKDQMRAQLAPYLIAYRDYAATGKIKLGDKSYDATLSDDLARGDFRPRPASAEAPAAAGEEEMQDPFASGVTLLIDVNGNGEIDFKGELFDAAQPFNINGVTYELRDIAPDGSTATIARSSKQVREIKPPPDHAVGKKITPFEATLLDGKKIKFPDDYKGKVVLLDFWATWCGPCMREVPNVVAAYERFKPEGFDVLGISLDNDGALDKLKSVTAQQKMAWPQVFEGKGWQSSLVDLYAVTGIPACWLVDGDTGEIVADERSLRGPQLSYTVEKALSEKKARN